MRWLIIVSVVIPLTAAFISTARRTVNHILILDPHQHLRCLPSLMTLAAVRGRPLLIDETTDVDITGATTTATTGETHLKKRKKARRTFSSINTPTDNITTTPPTVVNEEESDHEEEETGYDDGDGDGDGDVVMGTSSSRAVVGKKLRGGKSSPPSPSLPIFHVVPAPHIAPAVNGSIVFTVYGEPVPLSRHMVSRGRMYNPSAKLQAEFADTLTRGLAHLFPHQQKEFAAACVDYLPVVPLAGPLEATLLFYFKRPKNQYGTGKNADTLKPAVVAAGLWHSKRKDLDNLVKFVLDSLNGKAYEDDAQIAAITCAKFYTEDVCGRTEVTIKPLTGQDAMTKKYETSSVEI